MSQLGWIDFSPDDRNKVENVLALISEPGTLDELGIGPIRDAYSDALFPGISTIQTRAKYFITVPRIIRDFQMLPPLRKKNGLQSYLKERENEVARVLDSVHGEDEVGIIGRTRIHSGGVDRRPSVIYWNGLRTFGIVKTPLSLADYCRHIEASVAHSEMELAEIAEGSDEKDAQYKGIAIVLPDQSSDWLSPDKLRLKLSAKEANFLKQKLIATPALEHTVLTQLLRHDDLAYKAINIESDERNAFELLTDLMLKNRNVSQQCKNNIQLANEFSQAIEGPHIIYNIIAAEKNSFDSEVIQYKNEYQAWEEKVHALRLFHAESANRWLSIFNNRSTHSINGGSTNFVNDFCKMMQKKNVPLPQLKERVLKQAQDNKGDRSMLNKKLTDEKSIRIHRLDYRWRSAKTILRDILRVDANA